jgi:hypothetical protein
MYKSSTSYLIVCEIMLQYNKCDCVACMKHKIYTQVSACACAFVIDRSPLENMTTQVTAELVPCSVSPSHHHGSNFQAEQVLVLFP